MIHDNLANVAEFSDDYASSHESAAEPDESDESDEVKASAPPIIVPETPHFPGHYATYVSARDLYQG